MVLINPANSLFIPVFSQSFRVLMMAGILGVSSSTSSIIIWSNKNFLYEKAKAYLVLPIVDKVGNPILKFLKPFYEGPKQIIKQYKKWPSYFDSNVGILSLFAKFTQGIGSFDASRFPKGFMNVSSNLLKWAVLMRDFSYFAASFSSSFQKKISWQKTKEFILLFGNIYKILLAFTPFISALLKMSMSLKNENPEQTQKFEDLKQLFSRVGSAIEKNPDFMESLPSIFDLVSGNFKVSTDMNIGQISQVMEFAFSDSSGFKQKIEEMKQASPDLNGAQWGKYEKPEVMMKKIFPDNYAALQAIDKFFRDSVLLFVSPKKPEDKSKLEGKGLYKELVNLFFDAIGVPKTKSVEN